MSSPLSRHCSLLPKRSGWLEAPFALVFYFSLSCTLWLIFLLTLQLLLTSLHRYVGLFHFQISQLAKREAQGGSVAQISEDLANFSPGWR